MSFVFCGKIYSPQGAQKIHKIHVIVPGEESANVSSSSDGEFSPAAQSNENVTLFSPYFQEQNNLSSTDVQNISDLITLFRMR